MTREQYDEQRELLVAALAEFDMANPVRPPGGFSQTGLLVNRTTPSEPGLDMTWNASDGADGYIIELLDSSLVQVGIPADVGNVNTVTNLFSGTLVPGNSYYAIIWASNGGGARNADDSVGNFNV